MAGPRLPHLPDSGPPSPAGALDHRPLIELRQVVKTYTSTAGTFTALKGVDLDVGITVLEGLPVAYLTAWLPVLPRGRALDLAAGCGWHAVYLAQHGCRVDALDISWVGLSKLAVQARAQGLPVRTAVVDLDDVLLPWGDL